MKLLNWIGDNILLLCSLFLLAFIPLYPKLPLIDIRDTWVYIRAEDFVVAIVLLIWTSLLLARKITLKTPLTMPIILFWVIGAISTIHGILLIFPILGIGSTFPNLAFLSYLRRIEYLSMFFVAYSSVKDKRLIPYVVAVLTITLLLVVFYGFGQKYYGFPAFLTMNEEFAKGTPIRLSELSRISSTFGGHYDLAAYLVLVIPILASMVFGFKKWFIKIFLIAAIALGFVLMFMTVSRVSFFVLLISLALVLFFQKKKLAILAIISLFVVSFVVLTFSTSLLERFGNTVKKIDVLVDGSTGEEIGQIKEVPSSIFKDKLIKVRYAHDKTEVVGAIDDKKANIKLSSSSAKMIDSSNLPAVIPLVVEPNSPTGEFLPQGTGYVNLTMAPISKKLEMFFYQETDSAKSDEILGIEGNFIVKRVSAYDLSATTRFQGGWPKAVAAFRKNVFLGAGYSSTGLAIDNNYLRILGEVGVIGFISYFGIFLISLIYIKKVLSHVDSNVTKSFVFGFVAGMVGLLLNALLIDVFEASKIAYVFWILTGLTIGTVHLYQKDHLNLNKEFIKLITSTYAIIIYLFIAVVIGFYSILSYYFVGDDFTWFRWVADCKSGCSILNYFTSADGFFYRPGTKIYFLLMYKAFWLNQTMYHLVSILLHFAVASLVFLLAKKILKNFLLSGLSAFLFIVLSGYHEALFWISSTGFLFNAMFTLSGLMFYIKWTEKPKNIYLVLSLISITLGLLFHELGVVGPLIIIMYSLVYSGKINIKGLLKRYDLAVLLSPVLPYLILRLIAQSHWFNGDYSYNIFKLPFNFVGNMAGYLMLNLFGPQSLAFYQGIRSVSKQNALIALPICLAIVIAVFFVYKKIIVKMTNEDRKILIFGFLFFVISLLPFLGLGNITSRYSYLSSVGFIILFVFLLQKIYGYLIINGRDIAIASTLVLLGIFSLIHIIQLDKLHKDWRAAGEKSQNFLISLNEIYMDNMKKDNIRFYYVNVPIRQGDAWIFPVGLNDAAWFVFKNEKIQNYQLSTLDEAYSTIQDPIKDKIFIFEDNGRLTKKDKPVSPDIPIVPVN